MSTQVGFDRLRSTFFAYCKAVNTSISLSCWLLFKYGEFSQLIAKSVDPMNYLDAYSFDQDYGVTEYLSKYPGFDTGINREEVAISAFKDAERKCLITNYRIREGLLRGFSPRVEAVMFTAARKIASILGDVDEIDFSLGRWGPGATTTVSGGGFTMADKIGEYPICVSQSALPLLRKEIEGDIHWARALGIPADGPFSLLAGSFQIEDFGNVVCVPKNAKTDRTIVIGSTGNVFLQLAVGDHMKRRLRYAGINLYDQSHNQKLAKLGSREGFLATIDMKAASDTIAYWLVFALLPTQWFELLDSLRNPGYRLGDETFLFNKFSSMGNGYTFELESLIFWALAQSILDLTNTRWKNASIYGDDIIIPCESVDYFIEVCEAFGFTVNSDKTHIHSPFRESCGRHYYNGCDVTPVYQREIIGPNSDTVTIYRFANRITRLAMRRCDWVMFDPVLVSSFLAAISGFKAEHFVPLGYDQDDGLQVPIEFLRRSKVYRSQPSGGFTLPCIKFRPSKSKKRSGGAGLAYWMRKFHDPVLKKADYEIRREDDTVWKAYLTALNKSSVSDAVRTKRGKGKFLTRRQYFTGATCLLNVEFPQVTLP